MHISRTAEHSAKFVQIFQKRSKKEERGAATEPFDLLNLFAISPNFDIKKMLKYLQLYMNVYLLHLVFPACRFRGERPNGKFLRLREDVAVGTEVFRVLAYPRQHFNLQAMDGVSTKPIIRINRC